MFPFFQIKAMSNINVKKQQGFSLVELLIVVLTISIIAVIAIPNLLASRRAANEGSTISALRTLHGAQAVYHSSTGMGNYAGTVSSNGDTVGLGELFTAQLIDSTLGAGTKSGYNFVGAKTLAGAGSSTPATFFFSANPVTTSGVSATGTRRYCITQIGYVGGETSNLATAYDAATALTAPSFN